MIIEPSMAEEIDAAAATNSVKAIEEIPLHQKGENPAETAKLPEIQPIRHRGKLVYWTRRILRLIVYVMAFAVCLIPRVTERWLEEDYFDMPAITPQFGLTSARAFPVQFDSVPEVLNVTTAYKLTAGWNMRFQFGNPSEKHELHYSNLIAVVYLDGNPLWVTVMPSFYQGERHCNAVDASFATKPVELDGSQALSSVRGAANAIGSSQGFWVVLSGTVQQKRTGLNSARAAGSFKAWCEMDVVFSQDGSGARAALCKSSVEEPWYEWWVVHGIGLAFGVTVLKYTMKVQDAEWAQFNWFL